VPAEKDKPVFRYSGFIKNLQFHLVLALYICHNL
jgi:hypothetical protein